MSASAEPEYSTHARFFLRAHWSSNDHIVVFRASELAVSRIENWPSALNSLGIRVAELDEPGLQAVFISQLDADLISAQTGWSSALFEQARELAEREEQDAVFELAGEHLQSGFDALLDLAREQRGIDLATAVRVTDRGEVIQDWAVEGAEPGEYVIRTSSVPIGDALDQIDVLVPEFQAGPRP
ncbi:hypothetical protein LMG667_03350 [Xanthomonas euvesicatoria]|uniref:hypothetical protein n=1 Tax=Xanthomonas euvesicatoria TaxID=456327 RepID=UPI00080E2822|nr:hypothetical protein [Xanthomonas euvesicatoria]OCG90021.1 hypothetical protein LMG667_03350 [Xanthomonas euvesicatoria]